MFNLEQGLICIWIVHFRSYTLSQHGINFHTARLTHKADKQNMYYSSGGL